jgi:regulator of protease activity HflC (stomatin/prohibitin superfamily)
MQALIDFIIRNLLQLWPIARVYSWQQGLLVRKGIATRELSPGLHWRWWFIEEVKTWPSNQLALDLATASITTTDRVSLSVSANIAYRLTSIRQMYLHVWNVDRTLALLAIGEIATQCAQRTAAGLIDDRATLETALAAALNDRTVQWGLTIERVHLTDLVVTRGHRHYVDGMEKAS